MSGIFLRLVNMSIAASWIVLIVAALRLLLQRAPKWINCLLWAVVGLRLVTPFPLKSIFSLVPQVEVQDIPYPGRPTIQTPPPAAGIPAGTVPSTPATPIVPPSPAAPIPAADQPPDLMTVLAVVWLVGCAMLLVYGIFCYLRLYRRVSASLHLGDDIFICDDIASPFLLGILHPRVYLPSGIPDEQIPYILAHERAHRSRKDHLWKLLGFVLLAVYWFNPVMWLAYSLFCRDIELACDEMVIRGMGRGDKQAYSQALLSCAMPRRTVLISPLAFGEVGIKKRIKSVLHYRRPAFWLTLAAAVVCVVVAVCFLTDPYGTDDPPPEEDSPLADNALAEPAPDRRMLTADEIARVNAAFDPETGSNILPGPLSVYLVSNYETPYDLILSKFLTGFPLDMDQVVSEPGELESLKEQDYWPFRNDVSLNTAPVLPGLLLRIPAAQVEERLREGFGIGLEDLTYTPAWNLLYLEETDCFYRIANEVRFGYFTCTGGYLEGDAAVLLDENGARRLELRRSQEQWLFYSLTGSEPYDDFLYYDPLMIYGVAAQGQDDSEVFPDQMGMPTQTGWADEAQAQRYQSFLDVLEPAQVDSFVIFLSSNDQLQRVGLTWEQSMWFLDQLRTVRLAAAQPTEPETGDAGDTVSLNVTSLGEQWTIRHNGDRLYFGRYRDDTMWIFDGESCADIFQTMREGAAGLLTGSLNEGPEPGQLDNGDTSWEIIQPPLVVHGAGLENLDFSAMGKGELVELLQSVLDRAGYFCTFGLVGELDYIDIGVDHDPQAAIRRPYRGLDEHVFYPYKNFPYQTLEELKQDMLTVFTADNLEGSLAYIFQNMIDENGKVYIPSDVSGYTQARRWQLENMEIVSAEPTRLTLSMPVAAGWGDETWIAPLNFEIRDGYIVVDGTYFSHDPANL